MGSMSVQGVCVQKEDEPVLLGKIREAAREALAKAFKDGTIARLRFGLR